jgi:DNA-binding MarR family transcriptional regulator
MNAPPRRDARLASGLYFHILRLANMIAQPFPQEVGKVFGLTLAAWRSMVALAAQPGASGEDVADLTGLDKMSVSRGLRSLKAQGRAERRTEPGQSHKGQWTLTAEGWLVFDEIARAALAREAKVLATLDGVETRSLFSALRTLTESIRQVEGEL